MVETQHERRNVRGPGEIYRSVPSRLPTRVAHSTQKDKKHILFGRQFFCLTVALIRQAYVNLLWMANARARAQIGKTYP